MRRYFIIKSRVTGFFTIIDEEDATVFDSSVLQECLNVKSNLEGYDSSSFEEAALQALIIKIIKTQDPSFWEVIPNQLRGASVVDHNQEIIVENVSVETGTNLVRFAKELFGARDW